MICGKEYRVDCNLSVKRTSSPHQAVLDYRFKGWLIPFVLVCGNYVVVRHKNCRLALSLALPLE